MSTRLEKTAGTTLVHATSLCALVMCFAIFISPCYSLAEAIGPQAVEVDVGKLVKQAVVGYLSASERVGGLKADAELQSDIVDLLAVFDGLNAEDDLKMLASLSSYYIGTHGSELFRCLVLRKGNRIGPLLKELVSREETECHARLGGNSKFCYTNQEFRDKLDVLISAVGQGNTCPLNEILE